MPDLEKRIEDRSARVAVVGLGFVGLPLARRLREAGFPVTGIDKYIKEERAEEIEAEGIPVTRGFSVVSESDIVVLCVPTPLTPDQNPDLSFIREATAEVAGHFGGGDDRKLVVLESTSYPGTTREEMLPLFEREGLGLGERLLLAYAPERISPGAAGSAIEEIPRVLGGLDEESGRVALAFYERIVGSVVLVSKPEVAEMTKILENIFRAVNIALVNEMSLLCRRMDIDIWEVVEAAATKPFGFMPFRPGPGLGGHCIPVDPFYLAWKAKQYDFYPEFIELAGKMNRSMPFHVVNWIVEALNGEGKSVRGSRVLVIGVAYKEDVADTRESPALKVIGLLSGRGAEVTYHDSFVERIEVDGREYVSDDLSPEMINRCDCLVILTAHSDLDRELIASSGVPVVDTRNALGRLGSEGRG
ncbi:MAG: nucleotide sugar dehydrogenase [Actinomycetia bacterium]|nr:nucleotide sugar dehydrogenase [Actinomycetes bacterium]